MQGIFQKENTDKVLKYGKMCIRDRDGSIAGILHTKNDSVADAVKNEGTEILYGKDYFYEELLGLKFRISPFSFFQTNSLGAEVLYCLLYTSKNRKRWEHIFWISIWE